MKSVEKQKKRSMAMVILDSLDESAIRTASWQSALARKSKELLEKVVCVNKPDDIASGFDDTAILVVSSDFYTRYSNHALQLVVGGEYVVMQMPRGFRVLKDRDLTVTTRKNNATLTEVIDRLLEKQSVLAAV